MAKQNPVFGGWTPDQMRALDAPIYGPKVGVNYDGHPYVPGAVVFDHLNKITGWRWSSELRQGPDFMPIEVVKNKGKDRAVLTVNCVVRVIVHTAGGQVFYHDGYGSKTSFASPDRKAGLYENTPKMAMTLAIRDAAIRLGEQFGLAVMRLKESDEDGNAIDWRAQAVGEPTRWPDLIGAAGGNSYVPRQADIPIDEAGEPSDRERSPDAADSPTEEMEPPSRRDGLLGQIRSIFGSASQRGINAVKIATELLKERGVNVKSLAAIPHTRDQAEQNGNDYVDDETLQAVIDALEAATAAATAAAKAAG